MDIFGVKPRYTEPGTPDYFLEAVLRQQNQVHLAMLTGPIVPAATFVAEPDDRQQIVGTQVSAGLQTWLFYQALNYSAGFGEKFMAKQVAKNMLITQVAIPGAAAIGVAAAVGIHGNSKVIDKTSSLGGVGYGSSKKQKTARLGGF